MKSKNSQNNNDLDSSIHSINTTENIENDYFQHLKDLAIKETYDYFKDKHKFDVDTSILNSRLDLHKELVILQLKKTKVYLDIKEYDIPKNILLEYLNDAIEELSDYEQDKLGITTNSLNYAKDKMIKDYCLFSFEKLFHSSEIKKINNLQLIKNNETQLSNDDNLDEVIDIKENSYPEIFPDEFSFQLFKRLHENYKDSNTPLADFSFIYRKMYGDNGKYIRQYQKPEMFRSWLSNEPFNIILDNKFKTLDRCKTDAKEDNFSIIIELVRKEYNNAP